MSYRLDGRRTGVRRTLCIAAMLATAAAISASLAGAITDGQADGNGHPYVGVLVDDYVTPGYYQRFCSGTLVAPTIVLTATHCLLAMVDDDIWVNFDAIYEPGKANLDSPYQGGKSTIIHGTGYAAVDPTTYHGENGAGTKYGDSDLGNDIAVVQLDESPDITPAQLPPLGLLSTLPLQTQAFTAVGYGRTRTDKTKGPNNIDANLDPDVRNVGTLGFTNLLDAVLGLDQNPARGYGGTCYGDSGGPIFLGNSNVVVAITITGDIACRASGRYYRVDTTYARTFLAAHGVQLP